MRIVTVGELCADNYLPPVGKVFPGGNAANVAVHLKRAGIPEVSCVGMVGSDEYGVMIREALAKEGVDISHLRSSQGVTGWAEVRLEKGERMFEAGTLGVQERFALDQTALSFIANHDLVQANYLPGMQRYLPRFRAEGRVVSFDYGPISHSRMKWTRESLEPVDYAFLSAAEMPLPELKKKMRWFQEEGSIDLVVATRGGRGSLALENGRWFPQPAIKMKARDTLGAGDAFIAGFLARYLSGSGVAGALDHASLVAGAVCSHLGAWKPTGGS